MVTIFSKSNNIHIQSIVVITIQNTQTKQPKHNYHLYIIQTSRAGPISGIMMMMIIIIME